MLISSTQTSGAAVILPPRSATRFNSAHKATVLRNRLCWLPEDVDERIEAESTAAPSCVGEGASRGVSSVGENVDAS